MTRFSIRELLLVMVVVGLAIGWWQYARRTTSEVAKLRAHVGEKEFFAKVILALRQNVQEIVILQDKARETEQRLSPAVDALPPDFPSLRELILERSQP